MLIYIKRYLILTVYFLADINYFYCIKIVEILKETEADTRNLFGRYGSQRMKDWQEILRLYEKDNVYLAEAAQMLMRNVNYEVPSIKKQIQKLEQSLTVSCYICTIYIYIYNMHDYMCITKLYIEISSAGFRKKGDGI